MDLTPPSLTTSPAPQQQAFVKSLPSPPETCCPSEGPEVTSYLSPTLDAVSYQVTPPFSSLESCPISQDLEPSISLPPLDAMAHASWVTPDNMADTPASAASPSTIPNILSADYDPFANYESCLSASCTSQESYPPPPEHPSPLSHLSHTPPPATAASTARTTSSAMTPRAHFEYVPDSSAVRIKMEGSSAGYSPVLDMPPYVPSSSMASSYSSEGSPFASGFQSYMSDHSAPLWSRQDYDAPHLYPPPQAAPSTTDFEQDRGPVKVTRARRTPRRHTTKEEANFQCQVKGCGKFFSRSYNFKSHMETHDEKREYPFPCTIEGCSKKFVRKTDLQRHHQSVHMKERNHKCDYCGRLFARKDTLRRHMEDGCSKRFDIGTLDLRGENYESVDSAPRATRTGLGHLHASSSSLPPITMGPDPRSLSARGVGSLHVIAGHGHTWQT